MACLKGALKMSRSNQKAMKHRSAQWCNQHGDIVILFSYRIDDIYWVIFTL